MGTVHLMHAFVTLHLAKCDSILLQLMALFVFPVPYSGFHEQSNIVVKLGSRGALSKADP